MAATVASIPLPLDLLTEIDFEVGSEQRESFVQETLQAELRRRRLAKFLEEMKSGPPVMKDEDHPEFADGSGEWVRKIRAESEERMRAVEAAWNAE